MKLAVGFILYNQSSSKYLPYFLPSLEKALAPFADSELAVLMFDNSDPGFYENRDAAEEFKLKCAFKAAYYRQGENFGFAKSYNFLIERAKEFGADFFLVINPDTLIAPEAIKSLVNALESDSALGSVAPKVMKWDFEDGKTSSRIDSCGLILKPGLRFFDLGQGEEDEGQFNGAKIIGPSGAAGLFRLSALESIRENNSDRASSRFNGEYYDENFFMYKEDCDLAYRLALGSWKSRLVPEALVWHDRTAASAGRGLWQRLRDRQNKSRQVRIWSFVNQHYLFAKHWEKQSFVNRFIIVIESAFYLLFSLILEQFLLKSYKQIWRLIKS